jgi:hypothetical protein
VLPAINFDDHATLKTDEINKIGSDWLLPAKLEGVQATIAQNGPKLLLGLRSIAAQRLGASHASTPHLLAQSSARPPALRGGAAQGLAPSRKGYFFVTFTSACRFLPADSLIVPSET